MTDPTEPAPPAEPTSPAIPAPEDDRVAVLAAYLRSNQGRFTDEVLARKAAEAGYTPSEIAAARPLADDRGWDAAPRARPQVNRFVAAAVAIGYVIVLYLAISTSASASSDLSGTVGLVGLLLGVVGWALLRNRDPSIAQGLGCGVVLAVSIPIVAILVILGICIVTGSFPAGP